MKWKQRGQHASVPAWIIAQPLGDQWVAVTTSSRPQTGKNNSAQLLCFLCHTEVAVLFLHYCD